MYVQARLVVPEPLVCLNPPYFTIVNVGISVIEMLKPIAGTLYTISNLQLCVWFGGSTTALLQATDPLNWSFYRRSGISLMARSHAWDRLNKSSPFSFSDGSSTRYQISLVVCHLTNQAVNHTGGRGALPYVGGYRLPIIRPPFYTNLTPMDPFFLQSTPNDPLFHFYIKFYIQVKTFSYPSHTFWEIKKKNCSNFNIKGNKFWLEIAFLHTEWPLFLGVNTINDPIFWSPQWIAPFFNEILYRMPCTFVLQ